MSPAVSEPTEVTGKTWGFFWLVVSFFVKLLYATVFLLNFTVLYRCVFRSTVYFKCKITVSKKSENSVYT